MDAGTELPEGDKSPTAILTCALNMQSGVRVSPAGHVIHGVVARQILRTTSFPSPSTHQFLSFSGAAAHGHLRYSGQQCACADTVIFKALQGRVVDQIVPQI
jgi:hypothetical protein